jgi:hypothetical protein
MDTQETIVRVKNHNPRLIGPSDTIEFTQDFSIVRGIDMPRENRREFTTLGGAKRKQADTDKYRFTVAWFEPNNNVPERIYTMRDGGGDRTVTVTYIHSNEVIGRADYDGTSGGAIVGFIASFRATQRGVNQAGTRNYLCELEIQEA